MKQITDNVYVENSMPACNLGLITTRGEGVVLVDSPMRPSDAIKWKQMTNDKGPIKYLINTEEHPDHWLGTAFLPGTLISSLETRDKLVQFSTNRAVNLMKNSDSDGLPFMKDYQKRLADITFTDNMTLYLGDLSFKLFSLPGHSTGGIAVHIPEEKVAFTTDIVFFKCMSWLREADPEKWLRSLKKLDALDIDFIIGGHGEVCRKDYLKEEAGIIQGWIDTIRSAITKGWTKEEAVVRITLPDPYPKMPGTPGTTADLVKDTINHLYDLYFTRQ